MASMPAVAPLNGFIPVLEQAMMPQGERTDHPGTLGPVARSGDGIYWSLSQGRSGAARL
jgi:hypothetical protein